MFIFINITTTFFPQKIRKLVGISNSSSMILRRTIELELQYITTVLFFIRGSMMTAPLTMTKT